MPPRIMYSAPNFDAKIWSEARPPAHGRPAEYPEKRSESRFVLGETQMSKARLDQTGLFSIWKKNNIVFLIRK